MTAELQTSVSEDMGRRSSGSKVHIDLKLGAALHWLAGGLYSSTSELFGMDWKTMTGQIWPVLKALDNILTIYFPINDPEELTTLEDGFAAITQGRVRGCVAATDGLVLQTRKPFVDEVGKARLMYMNRKGYYGIVVQAFCDARGKFLYVSASHAGGTHDSVAYEGSAVADALSRGMLPPEYYVIGIVLSLPALYSFGYVLS